MKKEEQDKDTPNRMVLMPGMSTAQKKGLECQRMTRGKTLGMLAAKNKGQKEVERDMRKNGLILTDERTATLTFPELTKAPSRATVMHCQSMDKAWKLMQRLPDHKRGVDFVIMCLGDWDAGSNPKKRWGPSCLAATKAAIEISKKNSPIIISLPVGRPGIGEQFLPIEEYRSITAECMSGCKGSIHILKHDDIRRQLKGKMPRNEADAAIEEEMYEVLRKL